MISITALERMYVLQRGELLGNFFRGVGYRRVDWGLISIKWGVEGRGECWVFGRRAVHIRGLDDSGDW